MESSKSRLVTLLLCYYVGVFGMHSFYAGKIGCGLIQLFTFGCFGIWTLIDFILIICGKFKDIDGKYITKWME